MKIHFTKMHGLGNDFIVVDTRDQSLSRPLDAALAQQLCDRHRGVGADGVLLVESSTHANVRMRVINADGSEPEMCGNGIRCVARYVYEKDRGNARSLTIETGAGVLTPTLLVNNGQVTAVSVDMGEPRLRRKEIPLRDGDPEAAAIDVSLHPAISVQGMTLPVFTAVSMGNPHAVFFVDDIPTVHLSLVGPLVETHPAFPNRTNVEFVSVTDRTHLRMVVWERGVGATLACGTGACAVAVAGVLTGRTERKAEVFLPGGPLTIHWDETTNHVMMTGPAEKVFEGNYSAPTQASGHLRPIPKSLP